MAITTDDFNKIWASTSPLTPYSFSASQYKEGWNFVGGTPPSRQMWDFLQKNNDEKMQYLLNHFDNYLPLSGGTLTGVVNGVTPTAGDNSTKIATTAFVTAKAGNYLPLSGGTLTGVVNGVTPPNGDNSKKLATTAFVTAKAGNYLPLSGGTMSGTIKCGGKNVNAIKRDNGNADLCIIGGDKDNFSGATLQLFGQTTPYYAGRFYLRASTRSDANDTSHPSSDLIGYPDGTLTWNGQPLLPVGIVQAFAGTTIPRGWLLCDGSAVSRTTYANLYACIGTTYGAGNGSTTFNLPNLVDKFVEGSATAGTEKAAALPNITGSMFSFVSGGAKENQGALYQTTDPGFGPTGNGDGEAYNWRRINLDASLSSSVYGNSTTVQPPALTMRYIIKY